MARKKEVSEIEREKSTAELLLTQAQQILIERGKQYESQTEQERSFKQAAEIFNAITGSTLLGADVALILHSVKLVRLMRGLEEGNLRVIGDSAVDGINYLALFTEEAMSELE